MNNSDQKISRLEKQVSDLSRQIDELKRAILFLERENRRKTNNLSQIINQINRSKNVKL